jgi:sugar/nucleoside kinase (ribokinase family)
MRAQIDVRAGGSGANQAAWLAGLGIQVEFIGRVGDDPFGRSNTDDLSKRGVELYVALDTAHSTGTVLVLVDHDGERTMLTDRGASRHMLDVPEHLFAPGKHFHLSGYVLLDEPSRPAALHALHLARRAGMSISVDPVAGTLIEEAGAERFLAWTHGVDLCVPNLDEARALVGDGQPEEVVARLCTHYREVALKLGADGALWQRRGEPALHLPALEVAVVDTTGAGDAFCAGFLSQWLRAAAPHDALASGIQAGAKAVTQVGARLP